MHDVLITGGGPVGAALTLALNRSGIDAVCIESTFTRAPVFRPVALSHASRLLLQRWHGFDDEHCTPIHSVHVSQAGGFGRTLIRREDLRVPALGYVLDLDAFAAQLQAPLGAQKIHGRVLHHEADANSIRVNVQTEAAEQQLQAKLLVIADGGRSLGDDAAQRDYAQHALVALVRSEMPAEGRAWERFCAAGPLALLPFADRYALVWTCEPADARHLQAADTPYFLQHLQTAFGMRLGRFIEAGPRAQFPLQLRFRRDPVAGERCLAIGNAAQSLHPVAGQGLNLGLRDVSDLVDLILRSPPEKLGTGEFLATYRNRRRADRAATIGATDSFVRLFSNDDPLLRHARGVALSALDYLPGARRFFARRMVYGLRALP